MAWATTKSKNAMRITWEGVEYTLSGDAQEIPDSLAANIASHVDVELSRAKPKPPPVEEAEKKAGGDAKAR